ncbi:MAG: histidine phosphatase family protein [Betaproteobacteria bacterium]|jgi:phosphohistidine phosphatase|nr:histidine phosphatase family protein [Betaproteobacteria bacterium]NBZ98619.1 histidine phosphatase family protein [Betaproteobacteria bacterium]NDB45207.1 histidine phosphatase family protein [Betaproteobacteria bacterium]NDD00751.1 histidine phosphatase family protein [Betaproteobacteria bacterium]NDD24207.1 histidine phosphatase family protein [Betaproteobacteria bacterium]
MDLIFWRHAEAFESLDGQDDLSRTLTPKGEKQALRMSQWLDRQLPEGVRVMSSPAVRCEQTVKMLGRKVKYKSELLPNASLDDLLVTAGWPDSKMSVLITGHQPVLGQAIAYLLGIPSGECSVRKGAVWWLRSRVRDGATQTIVVSVQTPELL